jgi:RNA polymerase sigma-70 factor (ECF subfamily)
LSYEEIADVMKTSVGGLKANYHHALKKIKQSMSDEASPDNTQV